MLLLAAVLVVPVFAQDPQHTPEVAPPPLKTITRADRAQIDAENDSKDRVKLILALAETNLATAEARSLQSDYAAASGAIGRYWALLEDVFGFLKTMKPDSNKTRDLYKRVELTLRAQGPRLTAMRRSTPAEYSVWIKEIEEFARNGRTEALNSFYGHTVFREPGQKSSSSPKPNAIAPKASNQAEVKKP
jgi:hypothetical protein